MLMESYEEEIIYEKLSHTFSGNVYRRLWQLYRELHIASKTQLVELGIILVYCNRGKAKGLKPLKY